MGGVQRLPLFFSFSLVTIIATLFIDATIPGHDIPGGRSESPATKQRRWLVAVVVHSPLPPCRTKDMTPLFAIIIFFIVVFLSRRINVFRFPLYLDKSFACSNNERIVDRRYSERLIAKQSFSKLLFTGDQSNLRYSASIPTTSSRRERLECLNKCLNYTVHEK